MASIGALFAAHGDCPAACRSRLPADGPVILPARPCPSSKRTTSPAGRRGLAVRLPGASAPTTRRCLSAAPSPAWSSWCSCSRWCSWSGAARPRPRRTRSRTTTARSRRSAASPARQVGTEFFRLLGQGGDESPQDLQTAISGFRVQAEQQLKQAQGLDVPGEMEGAQESLLIALEWRRDGLDYIAQRIRTALGDSGDAADRAIQEIAGQMQVFLASDVAYRTRVVPFIDAALEEGGDRRAADPAVAVPARPPLAAAGRRGPAGRPAAVGRRRPQPQRADRAGPARHEHRLGELRRHDARAGRRQPARLRPGYGLRGQVHQRRRQRRVRRQGDGPHPGPER